MAVIPRKRRRNDTGEMSLLEHLGELRNRLFVSLAAIVVGSVVGWFLFEWVFELMTNPFCDFMRAHPQLANNPSEPCDVFYTSPTEPFLLRIKATVFIGFLVALPVVLYELWAFITPGLTARERKFALPFVFVSVVLFALGGVFAMITLPRGLNFLLGFAGMERVAFVMSTARYLGFVMLIILAFGLSFEFPLILVSLTFVGVLSSRQLRDWRRYMVLFVAVASAMITPSADFFTMLAMMVPLLIFYELAILVARLTKH